MFLIGVIIAVIACFISYIVGYCEGCMTGRSETMELYKNPNEQM